MSRVLKMTAVCRCCSRGILGYQGFIPGNRYTLTVRIEPGNYECRVYIKTLEPGAQERQYIHVGWFFEEWVEITSVLEPYTPPKNIWEVFFGPKK